MSTSVSDLMQAGQCSSRGKGLPLPRSLLTYAAGTVLLALLALAR